LALSDIEAVVAEIEREKEQGETKKPSILNMTPNESHPIDAERKRTRLAATAAGQAAMAQRAQPRDEES
jgi:20S proteasome subunit alpha 4